MGSEQNYVPAEKLVGVMDQVIDRHARRKPEDKQPTPGTTGGQAAWTGNDNPDHTELPGLDDGDRQVGEHAYVTQRHEALVPPTVNDDTPNYAVGDLWHDTNLDNTYVCLDATAAAAVWAQILTNPVNNILFSDPPTGSASVAGDTRYNPTDKTLDIFDGVTTQQVGQENFVVAHNDSGFDIADGSVVYISGALSARPTIELAKADSILTTAGILGIATQLIADGTEGKVTTFGQVRGIDTSGCGNGDMLYLSASIAGAFTNVKPTFPNYVMQLGQCQFSDAAGTVGTSIIGRPEDIIDNAFNGSISEPFDLLITSAVGVITASLEQAGGSGGDLTMHFHDGFTPLDCTPACTIILTAGTDSSPQPNYIYIPFSTKVLTVSTSNWPSEEHIKLAYAFVPSAAFVASDGCYVNQNWNDHLASTDLMGHIQHLSEHVRRSGAIYFDGIDPNGTTSYLTISGATVDFKSTAGSIYQMHQHTIDAVDTSAGDDVHVVNWNGDAYHNISNLFDITADSTGTSVNNKWINLVFWGVGNKTGEHSPMMCNLPSGSYTTEAGALADDNGYTNFAIPREFALESSTGFLIVKITVRVTGATWTYSSFVNLRGVPVGIATGGNPGGISLWSKAGTDLSPATAGDDTLMNDGELYKGEETTAAGSTKLYFAQTGDAFGRWIVDADGKTHWGSGAGAADCFLFRRGVAIMAFDSSLELLEGAEAVLSATAGYIKLRAVNNRMLQQDDLGNTHDLSVQARETWAIGDTELTLSAGTPTAVDKLDCSNYVEDLAVPPLSSCTYSVIAIPNFTAHTVDSYTRWAMPYVYAGAKLSEGTRLMLWNVLRRAGGSAETATVVVRCKVSATGVLDTCRIGFTDGTNTQSTTFGPTASWVEYTHAATPGTLNGWGTDISWFVKFPQLLTQGGDVIQPGWTLDVDYVEATQWSY